MGKWTVEADADTIATIEHHYPVQFLPERTCHIIDVNESGVGICDRCGGYAEEVDNYCPNCGFRVDGVE